MNSEVSMKNTYTELVITCTNNRRVVYEKDRWDDYYYNGKFIIVKNNDSWVAMYNIDYVASVELN